VVKSILDPSFQYTPSGQTDVRKTFARIWRELRAREELPELETDPADSPPCAERRQTSVGFCPLGVVMVPESAPGMDLVTLHWRAAEEQ
jgi:hypothetical protein